MLVKECSGECFGEVIGGIDCHIHTFQVNAVAFDPFAKGKVLDVNMAGATGGFCALPIAVQPSLSSYVIVAASCGMLRSQRMLLMKRHILPTSHAAMNSASVEERATVGWNLVL